MLRKMKKCLSLLLVFCMIFSMTSIGAYADEIDAGDAPKTGSISTAATSKKEDESVSESSQESIEVINEGEPESDTTVDDAPSAETEAEEDENEEIDVEATRSARSTSSDDFYKIVHVDAGRKYFSPENIKKIIDNAAEAGFNQVELYLSDNQGFRFALDDMKVTTSTGNTYDLTPALGDGYSDGSKYPDYSGKYLTQSEMTEIIAYAGEKGIEIVPCINVPGHMGAILEEFTNFRYSGSNSSIDLENTEAVAFALAITEKYAEYFASQGVKFYNIGADEYANDLSTMGFQGLYTSGKYQNFVDFINNAAQIVINCGMTPRAFNDGICYNNDTSYSINTNIQVCYWSSGWSGYNVASASTLNNAGYQLINTHGDYYWVLGNSSWQCSADKAAGFNYTSFQGGTISDPAGAMFCIWCDVGNANGTDDGAAVVSATADVIAAFGETLPQTETPDPEEPEKVTVKSEDETVSVTAPGLTSLNCEETTAPAIDDAEEGKVNAYDVKPQTVEGDYTGEGTVSITVPENWDTSKLKAFIVETDGSVKKISGKYEDGKYTFTAKHFSVMGIYQYNVEVTENKSITVTVGQTTEATINGANYAGTYTTEDPSIATVEVTGTDATEATTTYTEASVTCDTLISSNSSNWTAVSGYYYKADDGNYYPVYAKRSRSWSWSSLAYTYTYTWGYSTTSSTSNVTQIGTQSTTDTSTTPNITVYTKSGTEGTPASTTVTFTGVKVGTTYVTVGNTRYTINVIAEDLSKVTPLTVEFWITNVKVYTSQNTASNSSMTISAENAYGEDGVDIDTIVPQTAYSNYDGWIELNFWQAMRLDSDNHQTSDAGDDEIADGISFVKVRYYEKSWQYMTSDNTWHTFENNDQAVAYYIRYTEITKEITTGMKDWGYTTDNTTPSNNPNGQVALTIAVVYPDGTVSPAEGDMYSKSTVIFNYWSGRDIGIIAPVNNSDYDIAKITVTDGTRRYNQDKNQWYSNDSIQWDKTTNAAGSEWYDETEVWNDTMGTEPLVNGNISNITWSAKNTAKLVLIYLKPIHHESNLNVQWVDDSENGALISSQEIVVAYDGVEEPVTFLNGLTQKSPVNVGSITLDDDAYITNSTGVNQTFNKDITTIQGVDGKYTSGLYQYVGAEISADGKNLILHYILNSVNLSKQYVIDFGLPVEISFESLIANTDQVRNVVVSSNATYSADTKKIKYIPAKVLTGIDAVTIRVEYASGDPTTISVGFVPATTVYYEEGFAALTGFTGGSKGTGTQAAEEVENKKNNYGYDPKYSSEVTGASNGTEATSSAIGDTAEFSFKGTGVDIYTNNDTNSGRVLVQVKNSAGSTVKLLQVETRMADGDTDVTAGQAVNGYNEPIVSLDLGTYADYSVKITHIKSSIIEDGIGIVKIDGFRVYNTLGDTANDAVYSKDNEANPTFIELRDSVLQVGLNATKDNSAQYASQIASEVMSQVYDKGNANVGLVLSSSLTNTDESKVTDLIDNGPKNEIYLRKGESLVFSTNGSNVQIGLKALNASTTYSINGADKGTISSSTDMFYSVDSEAVTITNTGDGILAVTKLKVFGASQETVLNAVSTEQLTRALVAMGYAADETEPEVTYADAALTVSVNDANGKQLALTVLTANGVEGETHTFTAAEIQSAVKGLTLPSGYILNAVTYKDVTVVYGSEGSVSFKASKAVVDKPSKPAAPTKPSGGTINKIFTSIRNLLKKFF